MTLEELQVETSKLIGEEVRFKRIAGNTIIIYFFGEPGDDTVVSLFINPSWRYERNHKVIVGSADFPWDEDDFDSKEEYEQTFERMCVLSDGLTGARLLNCGIDATSSDVTLSFSDDQTIRNFANSAFDKSAWTYRNHPHQLTACISPLGISLRDPSKNPAHQSEI